MKNGTIFAKNVDFLEKNANVSKIKRVLVLEGIFSETTMCVHNDIKFHKLSQVSKVSKHNPNEY